MNFRKYSMVLVMGICLAMTFACNEDDGNEDDMMTPDPMTMEDCDNTRSYELDIVPIVSATCAIPNCHVGGFAAGDYTTYPDLMARAVAGSLENQITSGAMPPSNTAGPTELTEAQLATFLCWIGDGALEN